MSVIHKHAQEELDILLNSQPDSIIKDFVPEILSLCEKFGNSGQSGASSIFVANALSDAILSLCQFKTLSPLNGNDDEWSNVVDMCDDENFLYQNTRDFGVFKSIEGAYFLDAIIWKAGEYDLFTGCVEDIKSAQFIKGFPFTPKSFYIDVDKTKSGNYKIRNRTQLEEVFEYYKSK